MKLIREWLFPEKIILTNGKQVQPKRSVLVFVLPILLLLIMVSANITEVDLGVLFRRGYQFFVIILRMIPPNWLYYSKVITPLVATIMMSIIGTLVGALLSLPFAFLSANNIIKSKIFLSLFRGSFSVFRTLPVLVYALVFRFIYGPGAFAGTLAIALFTFTIMTKMLYEIIETMDMGAFEAIESSGASRVRAFRVAIIPDILGQYISLILYNFEMNVRSAAILGYVGAGGIGMLMNEKLALREYDKLGLILLFLLITVYVIETVSRTVRGKLN